uniref:RAP domain-containing protein n=1 Tax=Noctiluca scintillans TaxID=2966 RepID=A0A7S0ZM55_NOCSC|mmetsp:Transcript_10708/g.29781  ORF Transcript_10708/g.29781 Transcript_10708/m.29781 type:complete len:352 (+) Transcript_10708:48-1103(+)
MRSAWRGVCRTVHALMKPVVLRLGVRTCSSKGPGILAFVRELRKEKMSQESLDRFNQRGSSIQNELLVAPVLDRLAMLEALSNLRSYPITNFMLIFLEAYLETLHSLCDGETFSERADSIRSVLLCFNRAGVTTEQMRLLYAHVETDFPSLEAMGATLPMPTAVNLCHTMLATGLSSAPAIQVLLRAALQEPLMHFSDSAPELRKLKFIEMLLRVDFLSTLESLPPEVLEYLSVVRSLRYYDPELRRDTGLSYQLAYFLRKHGFPAKRMMLGPYALKVSDPELRINFEPVDQSKSALRGREIPSARKARHLEAIGWRNFNVHADVWQELETRHRRADFVRNLLKENELLET